MKFVLNLSILALFVLISSCKKDGPTPPDKLPNLVVSIEAKQNGTTIDNINFELVEQQGATNVAAGGSHQILTSIFSLQASGNIASTGPRLAFTTAFSELKLMIIDIETAGGAFPTTATYATTDSKAYQGTSGTFKITKVNLFQDIGVGAADYFVDFEIQFTMVNVADASDIITVEGDLIGVNIKQQ